MSIQDDIKALEEAVTGESLCEVGGFASVSKARVRRVLAALTESQRLLSRQSAQLHRVEDDADAKLSKATELLRELIDNFYPHTAEEEIIEGRVLAFLKEAGHE